MNRFRSILRSWSMCDLSRRFACISGSINSSVGFSFSLLMWSLTVSFQRERCRWTQNTRVSHSVLHQTDVTSHVRRLHLGNIQVSRVLGDEAATVLGNKWGELIKHPAVDNLWEDKGEHGQGGNMWHRACADPQPNLFWSGFKPPVKVLKKTAMFSHHDFDLMNTV